MGALAPYLYASKEQSRSYIVYVAFNFNFGLQFPGFQWVLLFALDP